MKLFISYARVDKPLCKQVVSHLEDVHEAWYDKRLHAGQDWWDEIQERLAWCEGFVYLLSPESVASEYCQKEYTIAAEAGKHIFPVLIQARTEIPKSLSHIHYADLSQGMEDIVTLINALTIAERRGYNKSPVTKPSIKLIEPLKDSSPMEALTKAADAMEAENFDNAVFTLKQALDKKPIGRIARMLNNMLTEAETSLEEQTYLREASREYALILELVQRPATHTIGCEEFADFRQDFPDYDPDGIADICTEIAIQDEPSTLPPPTRPTSQSLMPAPFAWIEIPRGEVKLIPDSTDKKESYLKSDEIFTVPVFSIAKYPTTNAQFTEFIKAGGYTERKWWTNAGWQRREKDKWTEPRYWQDSQWNGAGQPVVGVSWYEAIAFCHWLSDRTGEKIMLPTEAQWQYAAQGDDGRAYSWGNQWNLDLCNNNVDKKGIGKTTPVTQYEGGGNSPFGVVDMAGNVWEWCLTTYKTGSYNINSTGVHIRRGGSWSAGYTAFFRCDYRDGSNPRDRDSNMGFRVSRFN